MLEWELAEHPTLCVWKLQRLEAKLTHSKLCWGASALPGMQASSGIECPLGVCVISKGSSPLHPGPQESITLGKKRAAPLNQAPPGCSSDYIVQKHTIMAF